MRGRIVGRLSWGVFAIILFACARLALSACDTGFVPLFGLSYCAAHAEDGGVERRRARLRELETRLHEEEVRLAQIPLCPAPSPPPPIAIPEPAAPTPSPPITPPEPAIPPNELMHIPQTLKDLEGCWVSLRGDIQIVTDDAEEKEIGKVRECYCFGANGRGTMRMKYTNGVKCRGAIQAALDGSSHTLSIDQPHLSCPARGREWGLVPATIVCKGTDTGEASCDTHSRGRRPKTSTDERFRRVAEAECH